MDSTHTQPTSPPGDALEQLLRRLRRIATLGVFLFLALHSYQIWLIGFGPIAFGRFALDYHQPLPRLLHLLLFFCVLFYAIDGATQLLFDFKPQLLHHRYKVTLMATALLLLLFIPSAVLILLDTVLPYSYD